jgi:thioredoxin family protein
MLDFRRLWDKALPFDAFVASCKAEHCGLWEGIYKLARVPGWALAAVPPGVKRRLLVIAEDWCGDASNTVPIIARLAEQVPGLELRVIERDANPELMDRYLTNGARSIPIVIALDEPFEEVGHWGPRPSELQAWVMANRATMPKTELYPQVRKWYARDRGETTIREVLEAAGFPSLQNIHPLPTE